MAQEKKQSFMKGAAILSASTLLVKILGLLFSIPLANVIEPGAMSYFYTAYDIFAIFLMLSTAGLPVAVSRMVGTAYAKGRKKEADRVFGVAFWLFFVIGLVGSLVMFFCADQIAGFYKNPRASYCIMALAPTLFFLSVMSAMRGYFQGRSNMVPTAVSQSIEAVTKVIIGVGLAVFILDRYDPYKWALDALARRPGPVACISTGIKLGAAALQNNAQMWAAVGAITGVSASAFLGLCYLVFYKLRQRVRDRAALAGDMSPVTPGKELLIQLVRFAVPITLGSCFLSVLDSVDSAVIMDRLQTAAGFSQDASESLRAMLGHARKFFDLPGAFVIPIANSLLPALSGAIASRDRRSVDTISSVSMRVTLLISIPASVGMALFAEPICGLLLAGRPDAAAATAPLLSVMSLAIAFNGTLYTGNAILQSFGRPVMPVLNMAVGGFIKIALSYLLAGIPEVNAMGSSISTVASYFVIMVLNSLCIRRSLPNMDSFLGMAFPILLSAGAMGAVSYGCYWGLCQFLSPRVAVLPAIVVAIGAYVFCIVVFRAVTYEDVVMLPKGEALARLLKVKKKPRPRHMRPKPSRPSRLRHGR